MNKKMVLVCVCVVGLGALTGQAAPVSAPISALVRRGVTESTKRAAAKEAAVMTAEGATVAGAKASVGHMSSALAHASAKGALRASFKKPLPAIIGTGVAASTVLATHNLTAGERLKKEAEADVIREEGSAKVEFIKDHPGEASQLFESGQFGHQGGQKVVKGIVWSGIGFVVLLSVLMAKGTLIRAWKYSKGVAH